MSEEHGHHIAPVKMYVFVFLALIAFTIATVGQSKMEGLGHVANVVLGLLIAATKVSLVALFFMHLKWDAKADVSIRYFAIFPVFLFFILVFAAMTDIGLRASDGMPMPVEERQHRPFKAEHH